MHLVFHSPAHKECPRVPGTNVTGKDCIADVIKKHKFYLSFENTNCKEYITEKFWNNALKSDAIPIVMGASRDCFSRLAPPGSYIHVDDFETVEELSKYILALDADDEAYSRYFRWKQLGKIKIPDSWCQICKALHDKNRQVKWYDKIDEWWSKDDCVPPHEEVRRGNFMSFKYNPNKYSYPQADMFNEVP